MPTLGNGLIEKKKWYKNVMAVIALASALGGAVYGVIQIFESSLLGTEKVKTNIEIVLDRSAAMAEELSGATKWDSAVRAVRQSLADKVAASDNLALRDFGGPCLADNSRLVVKFAQDNERRVEGALADLRPSGETTLVSAIVEATGDFNDPERFGPDVNKSIIVITGGGDTCHANPTQAIRDRLREVASNEDPIRISFRLIGMGLSDEEKAGLAEIAAETGGRVSYADSEEELTAEIARALKEEHAAESLAAGPGGYRYLGCYVDQHARDLNGHSFTDANMTISMCVEACRGKGFRFASTQYSRECFCGNSYGTYGRTDSAECNYACGGRSSEFCGGYWRNSVYTIGDEIAEHGPPPADTREASSDCSTSFGGTAEPITCTCGPSAMTGSVWGTDTYTSDSSICRAALHAGAVETSGGTVMVAPAAGCPNYEGTERNGVKSSHWGAYGRSFSFPAVSDGTCASAVP